MRANDEPILSGKTAIITGGSRGIGRSIALELARMGANLVINYVRDNEEAEAARRQAEQVGVAAITERADVTSEDEVKVLMRKAVKEFGHLDILINNADDGRFEFSGPLDISSHDWELMLRGSLLSVFYCCKYALPLMRQNKYGRIVNIAAAGSDKLEIASLCLPYYIAKQGVVSLTQALAAQEAKNNITVNSVAPAFVENYGYPQGLREDLLSRIPAGRFAKTEEVAQAVAFLVRDEASYITGINLIVGGGYG